MSIEPMYSMAVAAELIPCSYTYLGFLIHKNKDKLGPPVYHGDTGQRMFKESEVLILREIMLSKVPQPRNHQLHRAKLMLPHYLHD